MVATFGDQSQPTLIRQGRHRSPPRTACRRHTSGVTPRSRPLHCRPVRSAPGPSPTATRDRARRREHPCAEATHHVDRVGRDPFTRPVGGRHEYTVASHLHDRRVEAAGQQRVGGPIGIGLADRHLALRRLPIAIVTWSSTWSSSAVAVAGSGQNCRPPVEIDHGVRTPGVPRQQVVDRRAARVVQERHDVVNHNIGTAVTTSLSISALVMFMSGAFGSR